MSEPKPLTGRKVLAITVAAFAVIIGANVVMMVSAIGTFPGIEVKNSYVASQEFEGKATAQRALGWTPEISYEAGRVTLRITDAAGDAVFPETVRVMLGRPTEAKDDRVLDLVANDKGYLAEAPLAGGKWRVYLDATAVDGTAYSTRLELFVRQ